MFSGVFIPREVLLNTNISANAKIIFAIIQSLDNDKGCYASNDYIGKMLDLSESSVRSSIADLETAKYITRLVNENGLRTIRTCTTASFAVDRQISGDTPAENLATPRQISSTNSNKNKNRKIKELLLPSLPYGEQFSKVWQEWVEYRKENKKTLTPTTIIHQIDFLKNLNDENEAIQSIRNSIRNGWSGLFPNQSNGSKKTWRGTATPLTSSDHENF